MAKLCRAKKTPENILYILNNLRLQDEIEMNIEFGKYWKTIIFEQSKLLDEVFVAEKDGVPIFLYGIVPMENNIGAVIFLSTDELLKRENYITFIKEAPAELKKWKKKYSILCNRIYKQNKSFIKILKYLGFKFDNPLNLKQNYSLFFYMGNLENEKNRGSINNREIYRNERAPLYLYLKMERYTGLCCYN